MTRKSDIIEWIDKRNSDAWDAEAANSSPFTVPISSEDLEALKQRGFPISLTGNRIVPPEWLGDLSGKQVLCLACGGGQQSILCSAQGARVTSIDNSKSQIDADRRTALAYGLEVTVIQASLHSLSELSLGQFDVVILGMGAQFIPNISVVMPMVAQLLEPGGIFISGFVNPHCYIFDWKEHENDRLVVRHRIPYSDIDSIDSEELSEIIGEKGPVEFGHSYEQVFSAITSNQLAICGFFEEFDQEDIMGCYFPSYYCVRAIKTAQQL